MRALLALCPLRAAFAWWPLCARYAHGTGGADRSVTDVARAGYLALIQLLVSIRVNTGVNGKASSDALNTCRLGLHTHKVAGGYLLVSSTRARKNSQ